jgi:hypothetical protein
MKVVANDADLQTALEFVQAALVCDPRNAEVSSKIFCSRRTWHFSQPQKTLFVFIFILPFIRFASFLMNKT